MHYTDYPDAPRVGTVVCARSDIPVGGYFSTMLGDFPVLVVHGPRAYVNACPHQFLPLDHRGGVIGADGAIHCSNHSASFARLSGKGISGHGAGCALTPLPITLKKSNLVIGVD